MGINDPFKQDEPSLGMSIFKLQGKFTGLEEQNGYPLVLSSALARKNNGNLGCRKEELYRLGKCVSCSRITSDLSEGYALKALHRFTWEFNPGGLWETTLRGEGAMELGIIEQKGVASQCVYDH